MGHLPTPVGSQIPLHPTVGFFRQATVFHSKSADSPGVSLRKDLHDEKGEPTQDGAPPVMWMLVYKPHENYSYKYHKS